MKKWALILSIILLGIACGKDDDTGSDPFKGEDLTAENTIGKVGNFWDASLRGYDYDASATIMTNEDGVVEVGFDAGSLTGLLDKVISNGEEISLENSVSLKAKISTNTIATFGYGEAADNDPFVLVKFDGSKGDQYTHTYNGKKYVREITEDDFEVEALGLIIKTMVVEESIPEGGMTITLNGNELDIIKIRYVVNHKFGFLFTMAYVNEGFPFLIFDTVDTNCSAN